MLSLPDIAAKAFADAPLPEIPAPFREDLLNPTIPIEWLLSAGSLREMSPAAAS